MLLCTFLFQQESTISYIWCEGKRFPLKKAASFERDFCVNSASYTTKLLTVLTNFCDHDVKNNFCLPMHLSVVTFPRLHWVLLGRKKKSRQLRNGKPFNGLIHPKNFFPLKKKEDIGLFWNNLTGLVTICFRIIEKATVNTFLETSQFVFHCKM